MTEQTKTAFRIFVFQWGISIQDIENPTYKELEGFLKKAPSSLIDGVSDDGEIKISITTSQSSVFRDLLKIVGINEKGETLFSYSTEVDVPRVMTQQEWKEHEDKRVRDEIRLLFK
jgi:hypothetical protein